MYYLLTNYKTRYPAQIQLTNNEIVSLTSSDNKNRALITEVRVEEKQIRSAFSRTGFEEVLLMEEVKENQIGKGMRKHINKYWDMHVRFLKLHDGLISIDAEVETNMNYLEHVLTDNWISVIYEVWDIVKQITTQIHLFHKATGLYVTRILKDTSIGLNKIKDLIEWKPIVFALVIFVVVIALFATIVSSSKRK